MTLERWLPMIGGALVLLSLPLGVAGIPACGSPPHTMRPHLSPCAAQRLTLHATIEWGLWNGRRL